DGGNVSGLDGRAGRDLVSHLLDGLGGRADEDDSLLLAALREGRVFGEEAVARVNRAGPGGLRRRDDLVDIEVGLAGWCRPQPDGVVGEVDVRGVDASVRVCGDDWQAAVVNCTD